MLVVHAAWSTASSELQLWAEDPAGAPTARRGSDPLPDHPFAADFDALEAALAPVLGDLDELDGDVLPVLLPSARRGPAASPLLVPDEPSDPMPPVGLAVWGVPALFLPAAAAGPVLARLRDPAPPFAPAPSLTCFAWLERLADAVATRGAYAPAVALEDGEYVARWRTVHLLPAEHEALSALASALPEAGRAGLPLDATTQDDPLPARRLLRAALDALVDARVRSRLSSSPAGGAPGAALVRALRGSYPVLPEELAVPLQEQLSAWTGAAEGDATWQLAFRVVPPSDDELAPDPDWHLAFELQHREDPSLRLSAASVWAGDELPGGRRATVEEHLLRSLGLAARAHPPLAAALRTAVPSSLRTDAPGVIRFLEEAAPLLQQAGFAVLTPPWFGSRRRLALRGRASSSDAPGVSGGEVTAPKLLAFRWSVALDGDSLSREELEALARAKAPLLQVRGQWVHLRPGEVQAAIAALERPTRELSAIEALRLALGLDETPGHLPVDGFDADGALGELLSGSRSPEPADPPDTFDGVLRPYQARGLGWLAFLGSCGLGACLADDMGLGKTIQVLALLARERLDASPGPTLLVCPLSVVQNWADEARRFVPDLRVLIHHGSERLRGEAFDAALAGADLVLTTYALLVRDEELRGERRWHRVVLDEAQAIKNRGSQQSRAARSVLADHRLALTGTPVENRLSELHSIMDFLNPGLLGGVTAFRKRFVLPIERDRQPEATERLRRLTQPFVLRRLKTDPTLALDLPDKVERTVRCRLTTEQATLYQAAVDELEATLQGLNQMQRKGAVLSALNRLKQACNHPAQLLGDRSRLAGRSGKLERTEEILEEALAAGDKTLLFTQYATMGTMLRARLQERFGEEVLLLHGGVSKAARDRMVKRFRDPEGPRLFVLSIKAGGTGLNLVAANHVIHFDRWWNPAVEEQATDRAYRIGQHRNVQVHKLLCVGTLEERIDAMIERKRGLAELVVGTGEAWLTELSLDELRSVIQLSAEAVA